MEGHRWRLHLVVRKADQEGRFRLIASDTFNSCSVFFLANDANIRKENNLSLRKVLTSAWLPI
jgi:hypothetical protein